VSCSKGIAFVSTTDDVDGVVLGAVGFWFIIEGRRILEKKNVTILFK
jgi:hypothetical protein